MKKTIFSIILFFPILVIQGCTPDKIMEYKGLTFKYPSNMTLSYDDFSQFDNDNITIEVSTITEFMVHCADLYVETGRSVSVSEANNGFIDILEHLRDKGVDFDVENLKSIYCGWGSSNTSAKSIQVNGVNGVVYTKLFGNSGLPNLKSFGKQVLFVTPNNQVYSIIFNYHFGELGDYIDSLVDENGYQGYLDEDEDYLWKQVRDYLAFGSTIIDNKMKMFEDNDQVIQKIIDSIQIEN